VLSAAADAGALRAGGLWLDENGLMLYEPSPEKVGMSSTSSSGGGGGSSKSSTA
jgi:hypothetical protein